MRRQTITLCAALLVALFGVQAARAQNAYATSGLSVGDSVQLDDVWYIVGKNIVTNGDFDEDPSDNNGYIVGWRSGASAQMTTTYMNWSETGGYDDGAYIYTMGNYGATNAGSIGQYWEVDAESQYYFTFWLKDQTWSNQYIIVYYADEVPTPGTSESGYEIIGMAGTSADGILGYANYDEEGTGEWVNTSITIETEEHTYLGFSARWCSGVGFDGFGLYKLYDPETTTRLDLLEIEASSLMEEGYDLLGDLYDVNALIFAETFEVYIDDAYYDAEGDEEAMEAYIEQMELYIDEAEQLISLIPTLDELIAEAESDLELGYEGASALQTAIDEASDFAENGYGDYETTYAAYEALEEAIQTYLFSQTATADNPADYTFLVSTPYYLSDNDLISITYLDDNAGIESLTYVNEADYTSGSAPDDSSSDGWYIGTSGGDQRLNYWGGRVCWNAWRTGTYTAAIYQDLEDLPNGYYSISCEMITQPGCISDQHLVANGTTSTVSPTLTSDDSDNEVWEWLTTEKALVLNGTLTIGAEGNQLYDDDGNLAYPGTYTDYRGGWFLVTNWRLLYYGEASTEDVQGYYDAVLAEAQALVESVYYAADKAQLESYIATYGSASTVDEMATAMDSLNYAIEEAEASIAEYETIAAGSLLTLQTGISDATYSANEIAIAQAAVDVALAMEAADDATYTEMDDIETILAYYIDSYLPVLEEAEGLSISNELAAEALAATISEQVAALSAISELPTTDELDEYIDQLNTAMAICQGQDLLDSGATDLTTLIVNSTVDASGNYVVPDGWNAHYNSGDKYTTTGQDYMDDGSDRYFDSWTSSAGLVDYTAWQVLTLPNGTYELGAMMRASGTTAATSDTGVGQEGVYLMAIDGTLTESYTDADGNEADTLYLDASLTAVFAPAHVQATDSFYIDNTLTKGSSYGYFTDSYGPIWAEAYDAVDSDNYTSAQDAIAAANGGIGYGWFYNSLQVTVTGRQLTIGVTTDSIITAGHTDTEGYACVPFSGTWFSADNFTLTLISSDDDYNIASGIESVATEEEQTTILGIYALDGRRISSLSEAPAGIYIVRQAGKTIKVLKR